MYDLLTAAPPQRGVTFKLPTAMPKDSATVSASALARALDVIDYGVLLVLNDCQVIFANQVARQELDGMHPLHLLGQELRAHRSQDAAALGKAVTSACDKGLQRMMSVGDQSADKTVLSIVPMPRIGPDGEGGAMIVFAKRRNCHDLASDAFARSHGLTAAEIRVMKQLCAGQRPSEIAQQQGVALCTVRTQIGSLREKIGASSIGELIHQITRLPPMPLRHAA